MRIRLYLNLLIILTALYSCHSHELKSVNKSKIDTVVKYYSNGKIQTISTYINKQLNGWSVDFYKNGLHEFIGFYVSDTIVFARQFDSLSTNKTDYLRILKIENSDSIGVGEVYKLKFKVPNLDKYDSNLRITYIVKSPSKIETEFTDLPKGFEAIKTTNSFAEIKFKTDTIGHYGIVVGAIISSKTSNRERIITNTEDFYVIKNSIKKMEVITDDLLPLNYITQKQKINK